MIVTTILRYLDSSWLDKMALDSRWSLNGAEQYLLDMRAVHDNDNAIIRTGVGGS
jgi:hypothetical protein